jgi:hypothetical protein
MQFCSRELEKADLRFAAATALPELAHLRFRVVQPVRRTTFI